MGWAPSPSIAAPIHVPDQVTVEVGDSDLTGAGQTQATFSTSSSTNRRHRHPERNHPSRACSAAFLPWSPPMPPRTNCRSATGTPSRASYFDASNNSNVVATATVDTAPPVISQVSATTGFGDATVSWTTSKPADSLVQYGESVNGGVVLLNRTAYDGSLVTNHVGHGDGPLRQPDLLITKWSAATPPATPRPMTTRARSIPSRPRRPRGRRGRTIWRAGRPVGRSCRIRAARTELDAGHPQQRPADSRAFGHQCLGQQSLRQPFNLLVYESSFLYSPVH